MKRTNIHLLPLRSLLAIGFTIWAALPGCVTEVAANSHHDVVYSLAPVTKTPLPPSRISAPVPQATLEIPAGMVRCSRINRPYIALKSGPGDQYPNQNSLLKKGTEVVLTYESQVWHKIYVPTLNLSGWVHSKALGASFKNPKALKIHTHHLPIITTVKKTVRVYPTPAGKPTTVTVPRGLTMARLAVEPQKQLIWLSKSPSVLWIDRRDAW